MPRWTWRRSGTRSASGWPRACLRSRTRCSTCPGRWAWSRTPPSWPRRTSSPRPCWSPGCAGCSPRPCPSSSAATSASPCSWRTRRWSSRPPRRSPPSAGRGHHRRPPGPKTTRTARGWTTAAAPSGRAPTPAGGGRPAPLGGGEGEPVARIDEPAVRPIADRGAPEDWSPAAWAPETRAVPEPTDDDGTGPTADVLPFDLELPAAGGRRGGTDAGPRTRRQAAGTPADPGLNPKYVFDSFVIGNSNRFAHAAAVAVAEAPARAYNPLFIYGESGLGKTHLLHAIGHYAARMFPNVKVRYVSTEEFTNEFINLVHSGRAEDFRRRYRDIDFLLIDDIQFLERAERTQEEFFHTFNTLHNASKQIVITSDRAPKKLTTLEDRLRTRFEWGLITDA